MADKPAREVLCLGFEPAEIGVGLRPLPQDTGLDFTIAKTPEDAARCFVDPERWDLLLARASAYHELGLDRCLELARDTLDASLILIRDPLSTLSPAEAARRGAADVVHHGDREHLEMIMARELAATATRKALRALRERSAAAQPPARAGVVVAQIKDYGPSRPTPRRPNPSGSSTATPETPAAAGIPVVEVIEDDRARALIKGGGLTLEYQPIMPLHHDGTEQAAMFEALLRLRDEEGNMLPPGSFFPAAARHRWLGRLDLWVFRRALPMLARIQGSGARQTRLFINLSTETLAAPTVLEAILKTIGSARIQRGTLTIEVRSNAVAEDSASLAMLHEDLVRYGHGLLLEHVGLEDIGLLSANAGRFTHIKLAPQLPHDLVTGTVDEQAMGRLVSLASSCGIKVIALAVDSAEALPSLYTLGVDYIQGHFVSMPYEDLVYPDVFNVDLEAKRDG
jgi:EAL domain-containing protein (putative c-di-GMP-specific phosphodiesterase class I)